NLMNVSTNILGFRSNKVEDDENPINNTLTDLGEQLGQEPELLYDGPFADQILNKKPQGLPNKDVDEKQASKVAQEFYGDKNIDIEPFEQGEDIKELKMPAHTFNIYPEGQQKELAVYIGVSQKGGEVLWLNNPRSVGEPKLSAEEAEDNALKYLNNKGFDNMEPNYSLQYDGSILFNFVSTQDDITIYPDLVTVKIAMDNGDILGFDASAYYMNH